MEKDDARKLSAPEQHERRRQVIRAHKRGRTRSQIAVEVGLSYTAVCKTIARYEEFGMAALAPRTRGRRSGEDRVLTPAQEEAIQRTICDKRPEQLKMDFALWSRAAVMQLIERGSRSPARSAPIRRCCCWTSPPPAWTCRNQTT